MAARYVDLLVGATAYATAPGVTAPFEPHVHRYVPVGPSGIDVYLSWDGRNDHVRLPGGGGAAGIAGPAVFDVSYKAVWARSANGVSGTVGISLYTRQ